MHKHQICCSVVVALGMCCWSWECGWGGGHRERYVDAGWCLLHRKQQGLNFVPASIDGLPIALVVYPRVRLWLASAAQSVAWLLRAWCGQGKQQHLCVVLDALMELDSKQKRFACSQVHNTGCMPPLPHQLSSAMLQTA